MLKGPASAVRRVTHFGDKFMHITIFFIVS